MNPIALIREKARNLQIRAGQKPNGNLMLSEAKAVIAKLDPASAHREAVLAKLESIAPGATNSAAPTPSEAMQAARIVSADLDKQADQLAELRRKNAELNTKLDGLMAKIGELKKSKAPASAVARQAETLTRKAAADLSAARRSGTITAAEFSPGQATMTRLEFAKLTPAEKARFLKEGGKLI